MRRPFLHVILLIVLFFTTLNTQAQGVTLEQFIVKSEAASVMVTWQITDESNIREYKLYRKIDEGAFKMVATIPASGLRNYVYEDDDIFKDDSQILTYELQVMKNNRLHKFYTTLSHNPTAIQRTWGSIKSMFK
jgi:hypothetical protein